MDAYTVSVLIASNSNINMNNKRERDKMRTYTDHYGFTKWEVVTEQGGRISITDYRTETDKENDIGLFSMMNEKGLGGSNYIRNQKSVDEFIGKIERTVWLNELQKDFLKEAINSFKN